MKTILLLFLTGGTLFGQNRELTVSDLPYPIDSTTNLVSYRGVVQTPNVSQDLLYTRAKAFLFNTFKNASAVIQVDDKAGGLLGGKGIISVVQNPGAFLTKGIDLKLPIELRFKEGRFRYEITNLISIYQRPISEVPFDGELYYSLHNMKPGKRINRSQLEFAQKIDERIKTFIADLTKALQQASGKEDF